MAGIEPDIDAEFIFETEDEMLTRINAEDAERYDLYDDSDSDPEEYFANEGDDEDPEEEEDYFDTLNDFPYSEDDE